MGALWRASKSRLVTQVCAVKTNADRLGLKPSNIKDVASWNRWVKSRTSSTFKVRSERYRELRRSQIPHTTSRKGMFRLAQDMKRESSDPNKVTRAKIWLAGHTHSDGTPVRPEFAETIEKIQSLDSHMDSTYGDLREDTVSQVLGKDKPGRVRGMGRGVTMTKLAFLLARDSKVEKLQATQEDLLNKLDDLRNVVCDLAGKKDSNGVASQSLTSDVRKGGIRCQLLDWSSIEDVVVGEGQLCSTEASYKSGRIALGPNAVAIVVNNVVDPHAFLWRPTETHVSLGEALAVKIPWPMDKVIFDDDSISQSANNADGPEDTPATQSYERCRINDWNADDCVVAEGVMISVDPKAMVNKIPLGPNAAILSVDKVFQQDTYLWRLSEDMFRIGEAHNATIAWRIQKVEFVNIRKCDGKVASATNSAGTTSSCGKQKCILLDCNNSGQKVAEGRVVPTDPAVRVHHVLLGPNAANVMVEVANVGEAHMWRPNTEIQFISDAVGSTVAWPTNKLKFM